MKHPFFKSFELSVLLILLLCGSLSSGAWAGEATDSGGPLGSGDGRIQVIPTLSAPSVKNGGKLTIQAVVKAVAGIARVEAEIEGITRLELKPASQNSGTGILPVMPGAPVLVNVKNHGQDARATMNGLTLKNGMPAPGDTVALYQTEWTAQGLEEKVYPVTLRVTDLAGHVYEDHSLAFSDPAAGNSTVGRAAYPAGTAPRQVGAITLNGGDDQIGCGVLDPAGGYVYIGTKTTPGRVVKVRLSDFTRVGALILNSGENDVSAAVIDPAGGYAFFGTNTTPGIVIKVRLSDFKRVGTLKLNAGEGGLNNAVIDPADGYAYFGTSNGDYGPASVVKIRINDCTRVGVLTMKADAIASSVIDPIGGYAYFGANTWGNYPIGDVSKVRLKDFTIVGTLALNITVGHIDCSVIDPAGGYVYFSTTGYGDQNGSIVKIQLSDFTRIGTLTITIGNFGCYKVAMIDPAAGYAYFISLGQVIKIRLSSFTSVGTLTLNPDYYDTYAFSGIDPVGGHIYFGALDQVFKVRLSDFTQAGTLTLITGDNLICTALIDYMGGYAYFGTYTNPGSVVKVRLSDFTRVGSLTLNDYESFRGWNSCSAIDPARGYAYFGTDRKVVKVRLSDLTRVGALALNPGEDDVDCAAIDSAGGYAYFGVSMWNGAIPGKIVKVRLSDFTRVATMELNFAEKQLTTAEIDPVGGYAYFGNSFYRGVIKVRLSDFTRVGSLTLNVHYLNNISCSAIDLAGGYAYFGVKNSYNTTPGIVVKVRLSDFTQVGTLTLSAGENILYDVSIDPIGRALYFATGSEKVVKVRLSDFTRAGVITLKAEESIFVHNSSAIDPTAGFIYFGSYDTPAKVFKVALSCKNALRANQVTLAERGALKDLRFYSHAAKGKLRLAIYDDATTKTLLWQSGKLTNNTTNGWVTVPVTSGTPKTLILTPGKYWLAWQTDSNADVPSYAPGAAGEGFSVEWPFGLFPTELGPGATRSTSEKWSEYLTYDIPRNAAVEWRMYP